MLIKQKCTTKNNTTTLKYFNIVFYMCICLLLPSGVFNKCMYVTMQPATRRGGLTKDGDFHDPNASIIKFINTDRGLCIALVTRTITHSNIIISFSSRIQLTICCITWSFFLYICLRFIQYLLLALSLFFSSLIECIRIMSYRQKTNFLVKRGNWNSLLSISRKQRRLDQ